MSDSLLIRAGMLLPISAPPLPDGALRIRAGCIEALGPARSLAPLPGEEALSFPDGILMPGLVNAHCHLELGGLYGRVPYAGSFPGWVQALMACGRPDPQKAHRSVLAGARRLLARGTTTVGDISTFGFALPALLRSGLRAVSFRELLGLTPERSEEAIRGAREWIPDCRLQSADCRLPAGRPASGPPLVWPGLSPHAPYSTAPATYREAVRLALSSSRRGEPPCSPSPADGSGRGEPPCSPSPADGSGRGEPPCSPSPADGSGRGEPPCSPSPTDDAPGSRHSALCNLQSAITLATHLSESPEEIEFLVSGTGAFAELHRMRGTPEECWPAVGRSPVRYLAELGVLACRGAAAHVNYLLPGDLELLAAGRMVPVYCPSSHRFFRRPAHPAAEMLQAGIPIALGTDSLASNTRLDMLYEARLAWQRVAGTTAADWVRAATLSGATALALEGECGTLDAGKQADLVVILPGAPAGDPYSAALSAGSRAAWVMVRGVPPQREDAKAPRHKGL